MKQFLGRWAQAEQRAACMSCGQDFVVVFPSLFLKNFPWVRKPSFCPFCGKGIDWAAIDIAADIQEAKE